MFHIETKHISWADVTDDWETSSVRSNDEPLLARATPNTELEDIENYELDRTTNVPTSPNNSPPSSPTPPNSPVCTPMAPKKSCWSSTDSTREALGMEGPTSPRTPPPPEVCRTLNFEEEDKKEEETENKYWSIIRITGVLPKCAFGIESETGNQVYFPIQAFAQAKGDGWSFVDMKRDCRDLEKGVYVQALITDKAPVSWKRTNKNRNITRWVTEGGCYLDYCQVTRQEDGVFKIIENEDTERIVYNLEATVVSVGKKFSIAKVNDKEETIFIPQGMSTQVRKGQEILAVVIPYVFNRGKNATQYVMFDFLTKVGVTTVEELFKSAEQ